MSPRYDDEWIARMLNTEDRLGKHQPQEILTRTGLGEQQTVLDMGCGPGLFTIPAATVVGASGRVHAVDIDQNMLDLVESEAESLGLHNINTMISTGEKVPLPDQIADYIICSLILHYRPDFEGRVEMARDIGRLVRPTGRILIIEMAPGCGDLPGRRMTFEDTEAVLRDAGLDFGEPQTLGERNYMIVATPPSPE